ncbi:MAG: hypothetical protein HPZ79_00920 [Oscillospiraceae bacterium]|nr:hypothetical protein [Oscillospiraceae bacterium]
MDQIKIYWVIEAILLFTLMITLSAVVWTLSVFFIFGTACFESFHYVDYYDTHYREDYRRMRKSKPIRKRLKAQLEFTPQPPDEELKNRQQRFRFYRRSSFIWFVLMPTVVLIRVFLF